MLRKLCVVLLCVSTGAGGGHVCLRAILVIFRQFHSDFMKSMFFFVCMFVKSWCLYRLQSLAVFLTVSLSVSSKWPLVQGLYTHVEFTIKRVASRVLNF